jgi:xanthine dehydrogenase accessory factor
VGHRRWRQPRAGGHLAVRATCSATAAREPELLTVALSDKAPYLHGVQCCGGEVTLLLEPLAVVPAVAVFGMGTSGSSWLASWPGTTWSCT